MSRSWLSGTSPGVNPQWSATSSLRLALTRSDSQGLCIAGVASTSVGTGLAGSETSSTWVPVTSEPLPKYAQWLNASSVPALELGNRPTSSRLQRYPSAARPVWMSVGGTRPCRSVSGLSPGRQGSCGTAWRGPKRTSAEPSRELAFVGGLADAVTTGGAECSRPASSRNENGATSVGPGAP